ncbi:MAG: response regulator [Thermodesulfovibrionales bacterium]|nr:response regulator [Thermodesulfovibrionales bacterium]
MAERILIVDDEPDMLWLLSMIIKEKTNYEVVTTNNPVEALELAKNQHFDILITDLKMPGLDGIELLNAVRGFNPDIPIIIITAYATSESATEAHEKNAFDFITKPFRKDQIIFTIEKAIKWIRAHKENILLKEKLEEK